MQNDLEGRNAVVTGSSTGIGRAIALELARRGARVAIHGRAESDASQSLLAALQTSGENALAFYQDFSQPFDYQDWVHHIWTQLDGIDIWINNAGADVLTGESRNWTLEEKLNHLFQVDVASTLFLTRAVGQRMKRGTQPTGHHSIINIGWDQAEQGMAGESGELFATTKGAIMSMTRSLAQSLAPQVRVNCIACGWIQTKWGQETDVYWDQRAKSESLMHRWGTPQDVANAAAYLSSPQSSFVSGQIIQVNGGFNFSGETSSV